MPRVDISQLPDQSRIWIFGISPALDFDTMIPGHGKLMTKADVRAVSHFRELDDVRADLDDVLADAIRGLGLSRPPALSVHVGRPGRKKG